MTYPAAPMQQQPATDMRPGPLDPALTDRTKADETLQKHQIAAWQAYDGNFRDSVTDEQHPGKRARNIKSNRCAAIVDTTAAWLVKLGAIEVGDKDAPAKAKGSGKTTKAKKPVADDTDGDTEDTDTDARQEWLDQCLGTMDDFRTFFGMVVQMGSVTGHAFVKITYDSQTMQYPRYSILDSQNVWVRTDPDDCNIPVVYVIEFQTPLTLLGPGGAALSIVKRQVIARTAADGRSRYGVMDSDGNLPDGVGVYADDDEWTIATYVRQGFAGGGAPMPGSAGKWKLVGTVAQWRYSFPPIVDCMNLPRANHYYGRPDLPPEIIHLNESLNDVQTNTNSIIEFYAAPQPWISGATGVQSIALQPGRILELPSTESKVGVIQASGDIAGSQAFANDLRADMDEQSGVTAMALGRQESLPKGNISGIAEELLYQPTIQKIHGQRRLYGKLIRCLCLWLLVIADQATLEDTEIRLHWDNLLPKDDVAAAQLALAMSQVGASEHAICDVLGLDYDEECTYKAQEAEDKAEAAAKVAAEAAPEIPTSEPGQAPAPSMSVSGAGASDGQPSGGLPTTPGQPPSASAPQPPVMHPKAVRTRRMAQAAAGKTPTPNGM